MPPPSAPRRGRGWLVVLLVGVAINPNVWVPLARWLGLGGVPPLTWRSAAALSGAALLLAFFLFLAPRHPRMRPVLFVYVILLAALGAAEVGLRLLRPPGALGQDYGYPPGLLVPDPTLGRRYAPDFRGRFTYLAYRDIEIRTNAMGFRGPEPDPRANPRVLVLGDSITFGAGVREGERYTDILAERLSARLGKNVEVQNWGVNGLETNHQRLLYDRLGASLPHRLTLVGFCLNDLVPVPVTALYEKTLRKADEGEGWRGRLGERGLALHHLFVVRLAESGAEAALRAAGLITRPSEAEAHRRAYAEFLRRHWADAGEVERLAGELEAIRDIARARGAALALVVFPYRFQFESGDFSPQEKLAVLAARLEIPIIDLRETFAAITPLADAYLPGDDCHPSVRGHRTAAEAIEPVAARLLTLPVPSGAPASPSPGRSAGG